MPQFLDTLLLLEEIFLCFPGSSGAGITDSIHRHIPTLKRIGIHERDLNLSTSEGQDGIYWYHDGVQRLLVEIKCDFVGINIEMDILVRRST